jgi:hypothetical protein
MLRAKSLTINTCYGVTGFPDQHINLAFCAPLRGNLMFLPPHVSAFPFQMAIFIQLLWRRKTKTSKMLPPVAAVLPVEKLNETLVK